MYHDQKHKHATYIKLRRFFRRQFENPVGDKNIVAAWTLILIPSPRQEHGMLNLATMQTEEKQGQTVHKTAPERQSDKEKTSKPTQNQKTDETQIVFEIYELS